MAFYYDRNKDYHSQWITYIQNQSYIDELSKSIGNSSKQQSSDFSGIISQQTREFNETLRNSSREQVLAIQESTSAICGTLNLGFELLSDNLQDISYGIDGLRSEVNHMSSILDWKLSLLIEDQKISNILSGNIAILLRIPDFQKERQDYVEKGLKFLKKAIFDNDLFENSLKYLFKAEEKEPEDFFVLHRIGLVFMYSPKHLNIPEAEKFFKQAAKYAIAETNLGMEITTNFLKGDINKNLLIQTPTNDYIKLQAAEAYLFAARCCYIQGKFSEAANLAGKAYKIVPQMVEAGFTQAKALSANNNEIHAARILESVINTDRFYSLKTLSDLDLAPKEPIRKTLEKLKQEALKEASNRFNRCKVKIVSNSKGNEILNKIERLVNQKTYLACKKAIDLLNKKNSYILNETIEKSNSGKWEASIKQKTVIYALEELIEYENVLKNKLNIVKELISKKETKTLLHSELMSLQSKFNNTRSKLTEKEENSKYSGLALLGGITLLFIGIYLWNYGTSGGFNSTDLSLHGFGKAFSPLVGSLFFLGGLVVGLPAFFSFLVSIMSSLSLSSDTQNLNAKEKNLKEKIRRVDIEIEQLENS
jgi:hypothetical protein